MDTKTETLLEQARTRGETRRLPYAGEVTPREAWEIVTHLEGVKIIDVRCRAELDWVGVVPEAILVEWKHYPGMTMNPAFLDELRAVASPEDILLFLCRAGVRSGDAAALAADAGFRHAFNILEGFEGDKDAAGQRGHLNGWRHAELPWTSL